MTEIFPRQFIRRAGQGGTKLRSNAPDRLQACLTALGYHEPYPIEGLTDHDTDALVSAAGLRYLCEMKSTIPPKIAKPPAMTKTAQRCEGWIFGVGDI
jgi:hypothetical protein